MNMKNKAKILFAALLPLVGLSGCWQTGDGQYVGVVTKIGHIGAVWTTWECEVHLTDQKGTMVADSVELSIDNSEEHGESRDSIANALQDAMNRGTRVRVTVKREAFIGCWRAETDRLIQKVEVLP